MRRRALIDPLRRPLFRRLATTYAVNELGDWMGIIALSVLVFDQTGSAMLFEAALSFLGAGVQAPNSSWGTMISIGEELLTTQPLLAIIPGTMILLTVLSLNIVGDGLRDALDPRSKIRLEAHAGIAAPEGVPV